MVWVPWWGWLIAVAVLVVFGVIGVVEFDDGDWWIF